MTITSGAGRGTATTPPVAQSTRAAFTLVELVVVILLLGILAAIALPRFLNVSSEARTASLRELRGALLAGASLANMQCRLLRGCYVNGFSGAVTIVSPDGQAGQMFNGYPTSNASAFASHITRWVDVDGFVIDDSDVLVTDFSVAGASDPAHCRVRYRYAATFGAEPSVELFDSAC
ncbi:MAG: prepilin-type N-terminal cleavage/methylation domain-containing protein [Pseudomonadota bacterium]